jgi:hypothetical protein
MAISRERAYSILKSRGYRVDETFQPDHGGVFCLGWTWVGHICRSVMSDGSVSDCIFNFRPHGFIAESNTFYAPGELFPEVERLTRGKIRKHPHNQASCAGHCDERDSFC